MIYTMTEREKKLVEMWVINMKLTDWCRVKYYPNKGKDWGYNWILSNYLRCWSDLTLTEHGEKWTESDIYFENLWHPLYIWCVMQWIWENLWKLNGPVVYPDEYFRNIWKFWFPDHTIPYHKLPEEEQKAICELLESIK
jgi:hypothetical protein